MHLATAVNIVRKDMLEMQATFTGSLDENSQQQSVPPSLLALVAMIHEGASINRTLPIGEVLEAQDVTIPRLEERHSPFMLD